jgi:hypothetical protein
MGAMAPIAFHPAVRILDALNPRDDGILKARSGGLTTVNIMPGSGHLMSGQTAYVKLRDANTIDDLLFCSDPEREICGGMKMANGTNPRRPPPFPGTRARAASMARDLFVQAQDYQARVAAAAPTGMRRPRPGILAWRPCSKSSMDEGSCTSTPTGTTTC